MMGSVDGTFPVGATRLTSRPTATTTTAPTTLCHRKATFVKAATLHDLHLRVGETGAEAEVTLDV